MRPWGGHHPSLSVSSTKAGGQPGLAWTFVTRMKPVRGKTWSARRLETSHAGEELQHLAVRKWGCVTPGRSLSFSVWGGGWETLQGHLARSDSIPAQGLVLEGPSLPPHAHTAQPTAESVVVNGACAQEGPVDLRGRVTRQTQRGHLLLRRGQRGSWAGHPFGAQVPGTGPSCTHAAVWGSAHPLLASAET